MEIWLLSVWCQAMTAKTIHLLKVSANGQDVSWACVPYIRLTGYLGPIGEHATQDPALVTCDACREPEDKDGGRQ